MEAKKRENYYWKVCLFFILLSPISIYYGLNNKMAFEFNPPYYAISMFVGLIAVFPFEIVAVLLRGEKYDLKFLTKYPEYRFETNTRWTFEQAVPKIKQRLIDLGFAVKAIKESDSITVLEFKKEKTELAQSFMDNTILGNVTIEKKFSRPNIKTEIIYWDMLLFDSGESEAMMALARYISLDQPYFLQQNINLTLTAGTMISFIISILFLLHSTNIVKFEPSLFISASFGAIGMIIFGLIFNFKDRKRLIGTKIGIAGLYLALLIFIPIVNGWLNPGQNPFR